MYRSLQPNDRSKAIEFGWFSIVARWSAVFCKDKKLKLTINYTLHLLLINYKICSIPFLIHFSKPFRYTKCTIINKAVTNITWNCLLGTCITSEQVLFSCPSGKAEMRPALKYCYHVWGASAATSLVVLDAVLKSHIFLVNDLNNNRH